MPNNIHYSINCSRCGAHSGHWKAPELALAQAQKEGWELKVLRGSTEPSDFCPECISFNKREDEINCIFPTGKLYRMVRSLAFFKNVEDEQSAGIVPVGAVFMIIGHIFRYSPKVQILCGETIGWFRFSSEHQIPHTFSPAKRT